MLRSLGLLAGLLAAIAAQSIKDPQLVGTWSSKSNKTLTGPGFYDPANERLIEPSHTGISYSFTDDGFYEEAYYRAISNPTRPECPKGIMQWQHGKWTKFQNGSLSLDPIAVDGRQLLSDPCTYKSSLYTRYNQSELFQRYEVQTDPYHNILRLNLFKFDGSPMMPMYLAYKPPQMLPTTTLNPTTASATTGAAATGKNSRLKRWFDEKVVLPMNHKFMQKRQQQLQPSSWMNAEHWWWFGLGLTGFGSILYFLF